MPPPKSAAASAVRRVARVAGARPAPLPPPSSTSPSSSSSNPPRTFPSFADPRALADDADVAPTTSAPVRPPPTLRLAAGDFTDRFVVLNKPHGMSVYASRTSPSVEDALLRTPAYSRGRRVFFPHRLDKASSGALVVAFHKGTVAALNESLARHAWTKRYRVLVHADEAEERVTRAVDARDVWRNGKGAKERLSALLRGPPQGIILSLVAPASTLEQLSSGGAYGERTRWGVGGGGGGGVGANASANFTLSLSAPFILPLEQGMIRPAASEDAGELLNVPPHPLPLRPATNESTVAGVSRAIGVDLRPVYEEAVDSLPRRLRDSPWHVAITAYRNVAVWEGCDLGGGGGGRRLAMFEAQTLTGRTHQLRVHFSECGMPVLGDRYYPIGGLDSRGEVQRMWGGSSITGGGRGEDGIIPSRAPRALDRFVEGMDMGLQAYFVAFPYPHASQRRAGDEREVAMREPPSTTAPPVVRGASNDEKGRVVVELPVNSSWLSALKAAKARLVVKDEELAKAWRLGE